MPRELPKLFAPEPSPCLAGFASAPPGGEIAPPPRFLTVGGLVAFLTPLAPSQESHTLIRGARSPENPRSDPSTSAASTSPPELDANAPPRHPSSNSSLSKPLPDLLSRLHPGLRFESRKRGRASELRCAEPPLLPRMPFHALSRLPVAASG